VNAIERTTGHYCVLQPCKIFDSVVDFHAVT
jgi:hypothetical protein